MAIINATSSCNVDTLPFSNFDDLRIFNGSTVTVSTNQLKCWKSINLNNGTLLIQNTSSTVPVRFLIGRSSGAVPNIISGSSGLGIVEITGSWIQLGVGDGTPNQTLEQPYTDFVPAVWVETSSGSNDFEAWINLTSKVGSAPRFFYEGLGFVSSGITGKFFTQQSISEPYPSRFTGSFSSSVGSLIQSGVSLLYTSSIMFGDNFHGNVIPSGSRVRIPNIMVTDVTPLNAIALSATTQANFVGTSGCVFKFDTALFDESYCNFTQPQKLILKNVGMSVYPLISECYDLTIENVALSSHPIRRYFGSTNAGWLTRDIRWGGGQCAWSYISNANINRLTICNHSPNALFSNQSTATALTTTNACLYLSFANNVTMRNLKVFLPLKSKNSQYGLMLNYINDSTFTNTEIYGGELFDIQNSANNTFTSTTHSMGIKGEMFSLTSGWRFAIDPATGEPFILGKKYYLKTRAVRNWNNPTGSCCEDLYFNQNSSEHVDSGPYGFTPYTSSYNTQSRNHPDYFGVYPNSSSISLTEPTASAIWVQRAPSNGYEIYRYTESLSQIRDSRTLVYSSSVVATVTYNITHSAQNPLDFNVPTYFVLRKYEQNLFEGWSESAEQECIISTIPSASNYALSSEVFSEPNWQLIGVTATANQRNGPCNIPIATAATPTADLLTFTSSTAYFFQSSSALSGHTPTSQSLYTFSIYLASLTSSISCSLSASTGRNQYSKNIVLDHEWQRFAINFSASTLPLIFGVYGNGIIPAGSKIFAYGGQLNSGSMAHPYITTTSTGVIQRPASLEPNYIRWWSRGTGGSGLEVAFPNAPANTLWFELHVGTSSNFIPSDSTRIGYSLASNAGYPFYLTNASRNKFDGLKQLYKNAGYGNVVGYLNLVNASSNNKFLNFDLNYNYQGSYLLTINTSANNNFFHNWKVDNLRNYVTSVYPILAANNSKGVTLQNIQFNNADIPWNNLNLDVQIKNVSGVNARPVASNNVYTLAGGTTDQNAISYGQVYDTIFNEWVWNSPSGSMNINFNASTKNPLPYEINGNLVFSNTGRLYFNSTGSITYEWPWKIYGISQFRPNHLLDAGTSSFGNALLPAVFCNTIDLGDDNTSGFSLKKEIAFDSGNGYGEFMEITASNPNYLSSSFDPSVGFKMKIRLTSRPALKYDGQGTTITSSFVIGEYVTGSSSGATALIVEQEDRGTSGTLILEKITGSFRDNERLHDGVGLNKGFANGTGSVSYLTNNILLPQPTSYITAMQWFTVVDTSSLYPISSPTLTLDGIISGSFVDFIRNSDSAILKQDRATTNSYDFVYDYFGDTPITIVIQNLGYIYKSLQHTLTSENTVIPIQQEIDRNYRNPV